MIVWVGSCMPLTCLETAPFFRYVRQCLLYSNTSIKRVLVGMDEISYRQEVFKCKSYRSWKVSFCSICLGWRETKYLGWTSLDRCHIAQVWDTPVTRSGYWAAKLLSLESNHQECIYSIFEVMQNRSGLCTSQSSATKSSPPFIQTGAGKVIHWTRLLQTVVI